MNGLSLGCCVGCLLLWACGGGGGAADEEPVSSYLVPDVSASAVIQLDGQPILVDEASHSIAIYEDGCDQTGHYARTLDSTVEYTLDGDELSVYLPKLNLVTYTAIQHEGVLGSWKLGYGSDTARITLAADTVEIGFQYHAFCAAEHFIAGEFVTNTDFNGLAKVKAKDCAHISILSPADSSELGEITIEYIDMANNFAHAMNFSGQGATCRLERKAEVYAAASESLCQAAWAQWQASDEYAADKHFEWWEQLPAYVAHRTNEAEFFACIHTALGG